MKVFGLFPILLSLALAACTESGQVQTVKGFAQGTTYRVSYWPDSGGEVAGVASAVAEELQRIDVAMSGYRADSTIERFNAVPDVAPHAVGVEIVDLVEQARRVNRDSEGCYDLTVKPLVQLWGFDSDHLMHPDARALQAAMASVGMEKLQTPDATHLQKTAARLEVDLSSIAQGYSVGRIARALERHGIRNYLVEIGGELLVRGHKPGNRPWRIAVEKPLPGARALAKVITILDDGPLAVMTSGTYRHFFDDKGVRYSHILDARTGRPVEHRTVSVTVLLPDAAAADAWSTALLCLGREAGMAVATRHRIPALFIEENAGHELRETFSPSLLDLTSVRFD